MLTATTAAGRPQAERAGQRQRDDQGDADRRARRDEGAEDALEASSRRCVRLPRRRARRGRSLGVVLPRRGEARVLDQRRRCRRSRRTRRTTIRRRPSAGAPAAPARRVRREWRSSARAARRRRARARPARRGEVSWRAVLRLLERRAMRVAAEDAAASGQRLVARQMNAAMRAGDHLLRRLPAAARRPPRRRPRRSRRAAARAATKTTTRTEQDTSCGSGRRRPVQDDLEHEARADVGEQQQRRARVDAARRLRPRQPKARRPASRPAKTSPAEDREHRLVVPAPVVAEPEAEDDRRRERRRSRRRRSETSAARGAASGTPSAAGSAQLRRAPHLPLGAIEEERVQDGDAEQAVRGDAEQPVQRRPDRRRLRVDLAREEPAPARRRRRRATRARGARRRAARSGSRARRRRARATASPTAPARSRSARRVGREPMPATSIDDRDAVRDPADEQATRRPRREALARDRCGEVAREGDDARHAERQRRRRDGAGVGTER